MFDMRGADTPDTEDTEVSDPPPLNRTSTHARF